MIACMKRSIAQLPGGVVALGVVSHGIGTARAFQISERAGAFAALAMGVNGLLTAVALPMVLPWIERMFGR